MSDLPPEQTPPPPPYPEIDPGSVPDEEPVNPGPPGEDETGRPFDG